MFCQAAEPVTVAVVEVLSTDSEPDTQDLSGSGETRGSIVIVDALGISIIPDGPLAGLQPTATPQGAPTELCQWYCPCWTKQALMRAPDCRFSDL